MQKEDGEEEEEDEWMKQADKEEALKRADKEEKKKRAAARKVFFEKRNQEAAEMRIKQTAKRRKKEAMREQARLEKESEAAQHSLPHGDGDLHIGDVEELDALEDGNDGGGENDGDVLDSDVSGKGNVQDVAMQHQSAMRSSKSQRPAAQSMYRLIRVQYVPRSTGHHGNTYHCWWGDNSHTWEPRRSVENLRTQRRLKWAQMHTVTIGGFYPTIKFTGAHGAEAVSRLESNCLPVVHGGRMGRRIEDHATPTFHRDAGKLCALNCVVNGMLTRGMQMSPELYASIAGTDPSLEEVVNLSHRKCAAEFSKPNGINNDNLLDWLLTQIAGVFGVEYNGHCVTWLAEEQAILDTDPRNNDKLPINENTLARLGISTVEKVYEICEMRPVTSKKRRRNATG
jgi:hypothetical protein